MSNSIQTAARGTEATLEKRLPELIDETLSRLTRAGVERMLELAAQMAEARLGQPPPGEGCDPAQRN